MIEKYIPKKLREWVKRVLGTPVFQRIIKNSSYLLSATGVTVVLGMVQAVYELRIITVAEYGLLAVIKTFSTAANQLTSFRIHEMVVRYMRLFTEQKNDVKAAAIYKLACLFESIGAIIAFTLVWLLSPWGAEFFGKDPSTQPLWIAYGLVILINIVFDSSRGVLQVFTRFDAIAVVNTIQKITTVSLVIYWYFNGGGLYEILLMRIAGKLVGSLGITGAALWTARQKWGRGWWSASPIMSLKEDFRSIFTFSFSTNISDSISLVTKGSETLWVSAFLGTTAAGLYDFASLLIGYIKIPLSPFSQTVYPELAREIANKKWDSFKDTLVRSSRMAAAYMLPVTVFLLFFGKPLISFAFDEKWLPAYPLLMILLIGQIIDRIFFWNRMALLALNRPIYPTIVNFVGMIIKVGLIFLLAEKYQAHAFAGLLSFYYIFTVGFAVLGVRSELNKKMAIEPTI